MIRIAFVIFSMVATTLAGALVVASLTMGYNTWRPIVAAAALGLVLAFPVTWVVATRLREL
jgi:hypothetical protein